MYVLQASLKSILGNSNLDIFVFCVNVSCCYIISYTLKQYSSHFMKDFFFENQVFPVIGFLVQEVT